MSEYDITPILSSIWPEWSVSGPLGVGTYGDVYKITRNNDTLSGDAAVISESAVKIIPIPRNHREIDTLGENPSFIQQSCREYESIARNFSSEIKLLETLKGAANVVHLEDYKILRNPDEIGWTIVLRMELLKPIKELYPFTEKDAIRLGIDICSALEICFQKNIIHRDIKPTNIFCTEFGTYKLGDFGISRIMQPADNSMTNGVGTPNFIAPEVIMGQEYDYRADIYSLGMVLYHLLNNQTPPFCPLDKQILSYQDRTDAYFRRIRGESLPEPVNSSEQMTAIIFKACAFRPEERYASAAEMKQDLTVLLTGKKSAPPKISPVKNKIKKATVAFALLALLTAAAGTGYLLYNHPQNSISAEEQFNENLIEAEPRMSDIVRLEVEEYPSRRLYSVGERPDLTGLVLRAEYKDGTTESIRTGYEYSLPILEQEGVQSIAVSYGEQTVTINLAVKELFGYELNEDGESYTLTEMLDREASGVTLPVSYMGKPVTAIGGNAFRKCSITELIVPEGYMTIEGHAFYKCSNLERIVLPQTLINFSNHYEEDGIGSPFAYCDSLVSLEITPGNPVYSSSGNCIIETASKTLLYGCSTIPDDGSVEIIGEAAFMGNENVGVLYIPEGILKIEDLAFENTTLCELYLPSTVYSIHPRAFNNCPALKKISISSENKYYHSEGNCLIETASQTLTSGCSTSVIPGDGSVSVIGVHSFYYIPISSIEIPETVVKIENAVFTGTNLKTIRIPSGVSKLEKSVFDDCESLETIFLPAALETVEKNAFNNCISLKTVYYAGSREDWEKITIEANNDALLNAEIIFDYTD